MRLDQVLVSRGLSKSRTEAQEIIASGGVLVNNEIITKQTKQVQFDDVIEVTKKRRFVSRGGLKLEGVLYDVYKDKNNLLKALHNKIAIDIGSSTGGFTDCLLSYGVAEVTAIDVGTSQLHTSLSSNPKIHLFENTDIRNFSTKNFFDIVVADLSFIPLEKVLNAIISLGKSNSEYFLLIKPQFEVGKGNTKKGIVRDFSIVENVLQNYKNFFLENKFRNVAISPCIISGGDGNQEYFLYAKK